MKCPTRYRSSDRATESVPREVEASAAAQNKEDMKTEDILSGLTGDGAVLGGYHRSRERTRKSAVLKLLERKQAEKEKEREKERRWGTSAESRARSFDSLRMRLQSEFARERSWARAPRPQSPGSPNAAGAPRRKFSASNAAAAAASNTTEATTKTYISIGPGKPTRIRENSPSKRSIPKTESAPASLPDFLAHSRRSESPSKKSDVLFEAATSPLKSASLLKDFNLKNNDDSGNSSNGSSPSPPNADGRKRSFTTQRTIFIGNSSSSSSNSTKFRSKSTDHGTNFKFEAFRSSVGPCMDLGRDTSSESSDSARSSEERDLGGPRSSTCGLRPNSSCSSSFSNLSESGSSDSSDSSHLQKRRESLERRFQERGRERTIPIRTSPSPSPAASSRRPNSNSSNDSSVNSGFSSASSRLLYNLSSGYRYHRATAAANSESRQKHRRFSQDHTATGFPSTTSGPGVSSKPSAAARSRKISVPLTCYEHPERSVQQAKRSELNRNWNFFGMDEQGNEGGEGTTKNGDGATANTNSSFSSSSSSSSFNFSYSKYKLCDDSLFFPGCCPEHDKISLASPPNVAAAVLKTSRIPQNSVDNHGCLELYKSKLLDKSFGKDSGLGGMLSAAPATTATPRREKVEKPAAPPPPRYSPSITYSESNSSNSSGSSDKTVFEADSSSCAPLTTASAAGVDSSDALSISTVSGSGIDFFRKFVQRRSDGEGGGGLDLGTSCKDCESLFRREVLIDRLVADSLQSQGSVVDGSSSSPSPSPSLSSSAATTTAPPLLKAAVETTSTCSSCSRRVSQQCAQLHNFLYFSLVWPANFLPLPALVSFSPPPSCDRLER